MESPDKRQAFKAGMLYIDLISGSVLLTDK